jgi:hypothetical protein
VRQSKIEKNERREEKTGRGKKEKQKVENEEK